MTQISTILQFHTGNIQIPETDASANCFEYPILFSNESDDAQYHFGTLDIRTAPSDPIPYTWDIKFSIDNSGSMSDKCSDGRTKLHHIKHTMGNIIRLFSTYVGMTFNVCIHTFNDTTQKIIDFTTVSDANVDEILAKISTIYDSGSTNLLKPIIETTEQMTERGTTHPANKQLHFLMTDGIDSCNNSSDAIIGAVQSNYETVVFGFGIDHDSYTLMQIGDKPKCSYGFIAEIEKAGIIYGEYIHNILYRICTNISIVLESAEIYSWKTNTWENVLYIDSLASDLTKTFYVRTKTDPKEITGVVKGRRCVLDVPTPTEIFDTIERLPDLLEHSGEPVVVDLVDHMFRYKTLELLYEANSIYIQNNTSWVWRNRIPSVLNPVSISIRKKLLNLYTNMRAYIQARYPSGSPFMESLLDDIYVSRLSFEKANMRIFSLTRHRTQGNQNVYTPTSINEFTRGTHEIPRYSGNSGGRNERRNWKFLQREESTAGLSQDESDIYQHIHPTPDQTYTNDTEYHFSNHTISQFSQEAYMSPTLHHVIRSTTNT